ncbi:MAG TPA: M28 family peptidase [Bryobacteraceae bacterium]|nr:M28 family peptidase [Bryobacteraceae bacterium]
MSGFRGARLAAWAVAAVACGWLPGPGRAQTQVRIQFLGPAVIEQRLEAVPQKLPARREEIETLFREAGCLGEHLTEEPVLHTPQPNVICVLPGDGASTGEIVAGGHYDLVPAGSGAVDDWSGVSLLPSLFESLKTQPRRHTFVFIGFSGEETGLWGSRTYVKSLSRERLSAIRAMVNLECLGLALPKVWASRADPKLLKDYLGVAAGLNIPREAVNVDAVGDDDTHPFLDAHVPVITIHSVTEQTLAILHSPRDNLKAIHMGDYYQAYKLAAVYLKYLDSALP